jgi:hypothetical protein
LVRVPPCMAQWGGGRPRWCAPPRLAWFNWEGVDRVGTRPPADINMFYVIYAARRPRRTTSGGTPRAFDFLCCPPTFGGPHREVHLASPPQTNYRVWDQPRRYASPPLCYLLRGGSLQPLPSTPPHRLGGCAVPSKHAPNPQAVVGSAIWRVFLSGLSS